MLGFNHTLAGSIVAVIVPAPFIPIVALVSHFILDLSPHFGFRPQDNPYKKPFVFILILDGLMCIACTLLAMALFPDKWFLVGMGAFFGILPDLFWPLWHKGPKWLDKFLDFAEWIQWGERPYGWIFDALYGFFMIVILYMLAR
jgi:hypothetical protein